MPKGHRGKKIKTDNQSNNNNNNIINTFPFTNDLLLAETIIRYLTLRELSSFACVCKAFNAVATHEKTEMFNRNPRYTFKLAVRNNDKDLWKLLLDKKLIDSAIVYETFEEVLKENEFENVKFLLSQVGDCSLFHIDYSNLDNYPLSKIVFQALYENDPALLEPLQINWNWCLCWNIMTRLAIETGNLKTFKTIEGLISALGYDTGTDLFFSFVYGLATELRLIPIIEYLFSKQLILKLNKNNLKIFIEKIMEPFASAFRNKLDKEENYQFLLNLLKIIYKNKPIFNSLFNHGITFHYNHQVKTFPFPTILRYQFGNIPKLRKEYQSFLSDCIKDLSPNTNSDASGPSMSLTK